MGRGGGHINTTSGRGGGGNMAKKAYISAQITPTITTGMTSDRLEPPTPSLLTGVNETSIPTVSVLMEENENEAVASDDIEEMEEEDDGLATIMPQGIPKAIPSIIPNHQWTVDMSKNLPKMRYGIELKIVPEDVPSEDDPIPEYHHMRIFKAIANALLTAAPTTTICSINDDAEAIINNEDIPTTQQNVDYYLELPTINSKTHTYHAWIYVSTIKPLFIIMKNDLLMTWLKESRIYLEENDMSTTLPTTIGYVFFVHPRDALVSSHCAQLQAMFDEDELTEFKVKPFLLKTEN
jgi:hypothetical protein